MHTHSRALAHRFSRCWFIELLDYAAPKRYKISTLVCECYLYRISFMLETSFRIKCDDWASVCMFYMYIWVPFPALILWICKSSCCSRDHEFVCIQSINVYGISYATIIIEPETNYRDYSISIRLTDRPSKQPTKRSNQGRCLITSSAWRIVKWVMDLSDDFNNQTIIMIIIMGLFARSLRICVCVRERESCVFCYWCSQSHTVSANKLVKIPRLRKLWTKNMIIHHWLFNDGWVWFFFLFRSAKLSGFCHFLLRLRIRVTWYVWDSSGSEWVRERERVRKKQKKMQSHSKHNHNRSITPAKWFMSRFMPGSLNIT